MNGKRPVRAVALYSGGLDSTLAILVVLKQDIEVEALFFTNSFGCDKNREWAIQTSERFGFKVHFMNMDSELLEIVKNPRYGYGKNMNPCIDCRILMLKEAKKYMVEKKAQFVITGEVLNQRPLSQKRHIFKLMDRKAELAGYVLRPLTAHRLDPTIPEKEGLVKRELLYGFEGRSRKPQMALAEKFGLSRYPTPAGGCLLTDPIYSFRLRELLSINPEADLREIKLLRIGRHFRLNSSCKAIVGRNKNENRILESMGSHGDIILRTADFPGPTVLITGKPSEREIATAASICARYSDGKNRNGIRVKVYRIEGQNGNHVEELVKEEVVENLDYNFIETLMVVP